MTRAPYVIPPEQLKAGQRVEVLAGFFEGESDEALVMAMTVKD